MKEKFFSQKICVVGEERKPTNTGSAEEHSGKNRSESVIPYDRNRVILSPLAGKEHSTYINASFIEVRLEVKIKTIAFNWTWLICWSILTPLLSPGL